MRPGFGRPGHLQGDDARQRVQAGQPLCLAPGLREDMRRDRVLDEGTSGRRLLGLVQVLLKYLDDRAATLPSPLGLPIVGELKDMEARRTAFPSAIIAVGDAALRIKLSAQCRSLGYNLISIVHPMAYVSKFATLGEGCAAFAQSAVNAGAVMGASCIVNTGATVDQHGLPRRS